MSDLEVDKNVTVHGVILQLSPVKASTKDSKVKYFSGKVTKAARVICFEQNLRPSLDKFRQEGKPVALVNCKVQQSKFEDSLEILTSKYTKVQNSPKKFHLSDTDAEPGSSELKV